MVGNGVVQNHQIDSKGSKGAEKIGPKHKKQVQCLIGRAPNSCWRHFLSHQVIWMGWTDLACCGSDYCVKQRYLPWICFKNVWIPKNITSWWLNQPLWKNVSQNGFIFPKNRDENKNIWVATTQIENNFTPQKGRWSRIFVYFGGPSSWAGTYEPPEPRGDLPVDGSEIRNNRPWDVYKTL